MALLAPPENGVLESVDPRDGHTLGTVPVHTQVEVNDAVATARRNAEPWARRSVAERARHLRTVRQAIVDHADELAATIAGETGKPRIDAMFEVFAACALLTYAASEGPRALRSHRVRSFPVLNKRATIEYSPYGVVGVITPWNYPLGITFQVLPSVFIAGNTVVLKPSELTSLTGQLIGRVINAAGVPLVEVVTGDGSTGAALVRAGVDKLAFTGSAGTARRILALAAESLTPVVMELGGKDPMIVCDDADVGRAARAAVGSAFSNAGQTCMATERVLATPGIYDRLVTEIVDVARGVELDVHLGPLTRQQQLDVVESRLAAAVAAGARILVGGRRRTDLGGAYFEPTVVVDVTPDMDLLVEETFAPILPVLRVASVDEAVRLANDSDYGLNASVFSADLEAARAVASRLVVGGVNVNDALVGSAVPALPFGGEKQSGFGRVQGVEGIREFTRTRSLVEDRFAGLPSMAATMFTGGRPDADAIRRAIGLAYGTGVRGRVRAALQRSKRSR